MNKNAFYSAGGYIQLPEKHIKAYVDAFCDEFKRTDTDTKLMHLRYATDNGYDIMSEIRTFLGNHPEISEDSIKSTMAGFIAHMRYPGGDRYVTDRIDTSDCIDEMLNLEEVCELLLIEIRLRFSYKEDDSDIRFSQSYLRWGKLSSMIKSVGTEWAKKYIINPTGYYPINLDDIIKENLWPELSEKYMQSGWYDETQKLVYPDSYEEKIIDEFNHRANEDCRYVLSAPAEPWRGNPLKAKVIILSLNPGFKRGANDKVKENVRIQHREGAMSELCNTLSFQAQGLLYPQTSYVKSHEEFKEKCDANMRDIDYGDVLNEIGDYYWLNNISRLNLHGQDTFEFFNNFAIVQYCAYTSVKYKDLPSGTVLPSQELTKELIRYLVYNRQETLFVIMRGASKWKELLDPDVWEKMQARTIINRNMSQSLSERNLGDENVKKIIDVLRK